MPNIAGVLNDYRTDVMAKAPAIRFSMRELLPRAARIFNASAATSANEAYLTAAREIIRQRANETLKFLGLVSETSEGTFYSDNDTSYIVDLIISGAQKNGLTTITPEYFSDWASVYEDSWYALV
jgi:hypothetical protein